MQTTAFDHLLTPISADNPCGPNLENESDYVLLLASTAAQEERQFGDFIDVPKEPNWPETEQQVLQLLQRTRDINLLILLIRCQIHRHGPAGLCESLAILTRLLETFPDTLHPTLDIDGEHVPDIRANALLMLNDPEGCLGDLRAITIGNNQLNRTSVHEIERALQTGQPETAEAMHQQLTSQLQENDPGLLAMHTAWQLSITLQTQLAALMREDAPDLTPFMKLLAMFAPYSTQVQAALPQELFPSTDIAPGSTNRKGPVSRDDAITQMRAIRSWFSQHEPSSPVALLLWKAENLVGQRFAEVIQRIPPDLLQQWDAEMGNHR